MPMDNLHVALFPPMEIMEYGGLWCGPIKVDVCYVKKNVAPTSCSIWNTQLVEDE